MTTDSLPAENNNSIATSLRELAEAVRANEVGNVDETMVPIAIKFADVLDDAANRLVRKSHEPKRCYANATSDPPQDCDAPFCGCNPAWSECISMLGECGMLRERTALETKEPQPKTPHDLLGCCVQSFEQGYRFCLHCGRDSEQHKNTGEKQ